MNPGLAPEASDIPKCVVGSICFVLVKSAEYQKKSRQMSEMVYIPKMTYLCVELQQWLVVVDWYQLGTGTTKIEDACNGLKPLPSLRKQCMLVSGGGSGNHT
jgi:hypothetical protein